MVREKGGPVEDSIECQEASYGHGLVCVRLCQGQRGSQAGTQIRAVDIDRPPLEPGSGGFVGWRGEMLNEELVSKQGIVDGRRPVKRSRTRKDLSRVGLVGRLVGLNMRRVALWRVGPSVVDSSTGEAVEEAGQVAVYMVDVLDRKRRQVDDERG